MEREKIWRSKRMQAKLINTVFLCIINSIKSSETINYDHGGERNVKRAVMFLLAAVVSFALAGCGDKRSDSGTEQESAESEYKEALDVLKEVVKAYGEDEIFAMYGGNQENAVMDAPGKFDISKTEELKNTLGLPEDLVSDIDDAASMVHMMNANTFTGAAYRLKDDVDMNDFADSVKSGVMETQWLCGQPDTLIVINVDGRYVITAYGEAGIIQVFKENALSVFRDAQVITEAPIQ